MRTSSSEQYARQTSASGLAAVWARDNTREALWDAMARKEVFATTGTRLRVRLFGGFFVAGDLDRAKVFKVALPKDVRASIQERAYTSPIWYTP